MPLSLALPPSASTAKRGPGARGTAWTVRHHALGRITDEILRRCPQRALYGTSLVHGRHPMAPDQLEMLQWMEAQEQHAASHPAGHVPVPSWWSMTRQWMACLLFTLRDTGQLAWLKARFGRALRRRMREPAEIVIKTWGFEPEREGGTPDFYFGTLPHALRARGIRTLVVSGDGRGNLHEAFVEGLFRREAGGVVPEALLIPLWAPLVTAFRLIPQGLAVRRLARKSADPVFRRVCSQVALECVGPYTMRNLTHGSIARQAVRAWRPRVFLTLYEGQPWEQVAWHGAKMEDPTCVVAGCQHTVVMPHSRSLLAPRADTVVRATPDVVLCTGPRTEAMMRPGHQLQGTRFVAFGSFRRTRRAERVEPRPDRKTVLVLPEGVVSEAIALFDWAMKVAAATTDHRFLFRCHPNFPFSAIRSQLRRDPSELPNVELSGRRAIDEEFARASVIVYRGSSSVFYAILHGLKPIYLHVPTLPDVDPLFELSGWCQRISSPEEGSEALGRYAVLPAYEAAGEWRPAADYIERYTMPVDEASIGRFLEAVGLADRSQG